MSNTFYKLNNELKNTLDEILKIKNYNNSISEEKFNRNNIEKLIEMGYVEYVGDATSFDGWGCFIRPTYNGEHYNDLKRDYNNHNIKEWIKFWIPVVVSVLSFGFSIFTFLYK